MNFSKITVKTSLLFIVILGFSLRVVNLTYAFPNLYMSSDEASYHLSALLMIANKTLFTTGNYGPLGAYLQIPFLALSSLILFLANKINSFSELQILVATHEGYFLFIPRVISAMFGTLTILLVYHLSRLMFRNKKIALFSSLLCALSFNLVFVSHQARALSPAIFFSLLGSYFALKAIWVKSKFNRFSTLSMIFCAISFGFYQIAGLIVILCLLILRNADFRFRVFLKRMLWPFLVFILLITALNYLSLGSQFFSILNPANKSDSVELIQIGTSTSFSFHLIYNFFKKLLLSDTLIVLLFLPIFFLKEFRAKIYRPFKLFIIFNLFLSLLVFPTFIRYFLIAFSFFPLFAGAILYRFFIKVKYKFIFLVFIIAFTAFNSVYFNFLLIRKNTYSMMREWVDKNLSPQTPIIATTYKGIGYVPVKTATLKIKERNPNYYKKTSQILNDQYLPNTRFIVYAGEFAEKGMNKADYTKTAVSFFGASIVIDQYLKSTERLYLNNDGLELELLAHFSSTGDKVYDRFIPEVSSDSSFFFPLFRLERPGPYFDILKIIK